MARGEIVCLLIAAGLRHILILSNISLIQNRVEISTPLNSFKRIKEGVHLYENNIDPYSGDMVHESPLILIFHKYLFNYYAQLTPLIYILFDVLVAVFLSKMARIWVEEKLSEEKKSATEFAPGTEDLQMQPCDIDTIPNYVLFAYLLNPFSISNCASLTSTVFSNLFLSLYFYHLAKKQQIRCLVFLALECTRSLYPLVLISPVIIVFGRKSIYKTVRVIFQFVVLCLVVCFVNFKLSGNWTFIDGTLGFIFFYRDLQPNIGLFWYFFTEMFEHFRPMFLITFQMNATILYLIPLSLKLRKDPVLLASILVSLMTIFKSYPCFGDVGFYLSLLPIWKRCWKFMAHNFVVFCFFLTTVLIMPALWHLWIYAGSANANFYFGATLAFSTGQIFLVTDLLFAYVKREFCLRNGEKLYIDGKEAKIVLE